MGRRSVATGGSRVVALLRGVNVGGRTLSMAALRDRLSAEGCADVVTYIQSGNVVLTPPTGAGTSDLAVWLASIASAVAGYDVPVVVRTAVELRRVVDVNPYPHAGGSTLHVMFFGDAEVGGVLAGLDLDGFAPEHTTLVGRDLYLHLPHGMGRAKLPSAVEQAARRSRPPVLGTARNWNTVLRLVDLAGG